MSAKVNAILVIVAGAVLWGVNQLFTQPDGTQPFGIVGNAIGTILFVVGIVMIIKAYRKSKTH